MGEKKFLKYVAGILLSAVSLLFIVANADALPENERRYALIFVIDGIPTPEFYEMLDEERLPNFRKHIFERGTYSAHHITVFPPLTFPVMASMFSGMYPSNHGVPTFFWVDRNEAIYKNYLSVLYPEYQRDVGQNVHSLFEYFPGKRTLCFGLPINAGAYHKRSLTGSFIDIFRETRDTDYVAKAVEQEHTIDLDMFLKPAKLLSLFNPAMDTNIISLMNPFSRSGILKYTVSSFSESGRQIRRQVPEIVLYYEWAADHHGHEEGPGGQETRQSLVEADTQFGRLVEVYQRANLYSDTLFLLLSDHGQIPVEPDYVQINRFFSEKGFKAAFVSHELIAKSGLSGLLRINSILIGSGKVAGYNCILGTAGGGSVSAYLTRSGGTDAESWKSEVYYRDLLNYPIAPGVRIDVADFINSIDGIKFFLVRENERLPGEPHMTRIIGPEGSSLITARVSEGKPVELKYDVLSGTDPLGYAEDPAVSKLVSSGYFDDRKWLSATAEADHPDALVQIAQIMELDRSGSIIMVPYDWQAYNSRVWSKHGGLSALEMNTVFAISGPGVRSGVIPSSRVVDILPTFLSLMGNEFASAQFDGIVLKDVMEPREPVAQAQAFAGKEI